MTNFEKLQSEVAALSARVEKASTAENLAALVAASKLKPNATGHRPTSFEAMANLKADLTDWIAHNEQLPDAPVKIEARKPTALPVQPRPAPLTAEEIATAHRAAFDKVLKEQGTKAAMAFANERGLL